MAILHTVHDDDFIQFLTNIGLLKNVTLGKARCKICGDSVTLDTIETVFPDGGTIHVTCSKPECAEKLPNYLADKKIG